jgi:hypothetical protein
VLFTRLIEPPDILVTTPVPPVRPKVGEDVQPPAVQMFTVPPDWVYVTKTFELVSRPA